MVQVYYFRIQRFIFRMPADPRPDAGTFPKNCFKECDIELIKQSPLINPFFEGKRSRKPLRLDFCPVGPA